MKKRDKIWLFIMIFIMFMDIIMHFTTCDTSFSYHLNYIASVMVAFTLGLWIADTPRMKGLDKDDETD